MIFESIKLREINKYLSSAAILDVFVPIFSYDEAENITRKPILIIPGGAYSFVAESEAEPVAFAFMKAGFAAFVLKYTVGPYDKDEYVAQKEAFAAISYIKENAKKYHLDLSNFSVVGFSAGGHLTATLGMMYQDENMAKMIGKSQKDLHIDNLILSYPVISMKEKLTHPETAYNRTLNKPELIAKYSIEDHISSNYPRTFIWTTANDELVKANNSIILASKLSETNVPFELHVYDNGPHGLNIVTDENYEKCRSWVENCIKFINTLC